MLVKIINGFYGLHTKTGIKAVGANDNPINLPDDEAKRIIALGIAKSVVDTDVATAVNEENADEASDNITEDENATESDLEGDSDTLPSYDVSMKITQLREIAKEFGISTPVGMSKEEIVKALDEYFNGDMPDLDVQAPVVE